MNGSFLLMCKQSYLEGITPSNKSTHNNDTYQKLVALAKQDFDNGQYDDFSGYFMEGQYLIPLWAAHMLVEYGKPKKELMIKAMNIIKKYTDNPLAPDVAEEEKEWLSKNAIVYKDFL